MVVIVRQLSTTLSTAAAAAAAKSLQSCPTLCHPLDCSPPGSSVHGILQARILELVAISFPRGSYQPRSSALQVDSLLPEPPGKPDVTELYI